MSLLRYGLRLLGWAIAAHYFRFLGFSPNAAPWE